MEKFRILSLGLSALLVTACSHFQQGTMFGPKKLILGGIEYSETNFGKFTSWRCRSYIQNSSIHVEAGRFSDPDLLSVGFILYDGGNTGVLANYRRHGLNHRWDWGLGDSTASLLNTKFTFMIKPDGTGLYYDFSATPDGESKKADDVYKCSQ